MHHDNNFAKPNKDTTLGEAFSWHTRTSNPGNYQCFMQKAWKSCKDICLRPLSQSFRITFCMSMFVGLPKWPVYGTLALAVFTPSECKMHQAARLDVVTF